MGIPASRTKVSKPVGTAMVSRRADAEVIMKACGSPRGRKSADPALARHSRSPATATISPSRT